VPSGKYHPEADETDAYMYTSHEFVFRLSLRVAQLRMDSILEPGDESLLTDDI